MVSDHESATEASCLEGDGLVSLWDKTQVKYEMTLLAKLESRTRRNLHVRFGAGERLKSPTYRYNMVGSYNRASALWPCYASSFAVP